VRLSRQARENLGLVSAPLERTRFWRTIEVPGVIVDRPGISIQGVIAPVTGAVTAIHHFPGDMVMSGEPLFSIRLLSESLHASQAELFKATQEIAIAQKQLSRLAGAATSGALAGSRIIEIENDIQRRRVVVEATRQDLQSRGLSREDIAAASEGRFVTEIVVKVPERRAPSHSVYNTVADKATDTDARALELHSLQIDLGQQVEAGQALAQLADHRALFIEGRTFKDDMPLIQQAARQAWKVQIDFGPQSMGDWPPPPSQLPIHRIANAMDPDTRTFAFYLALENQSLPYMTADGDARLLWRFRRGGRVRLRVPVEEFDQALVLPRDAVVRDGPEAYVFRQNGDLFERRSVRILHEDRLHAVLGNDGSVSPGWYLAQNSAAALNRVLKAQGVGDAPANVHAHADGTIHEAH
jgi:biotin carboxyl carrier protein